MECWRKFFLEIEEIYVVETKSNTAQQFIIGQQARNRKGPNCLLSQRIQVKKPSRFRCFQHLRLVVSCAILNTTTPLIFTLFYLSSLELMLFQSYMFSKEVDITEVDIVVKIWPSI